MNMMKSLISTALGLAILTVASSAQQKTVPYDTVQHTGRATLDWATGEITTQSSDKLGLVLKWANTDTSGYLATPPAPNIWVDWGVMGDSSTSSDIVGDFSFAYGTATPGINWGGPGVPVCVEWYNGFQGLCLDTGLGLQPEAQYCFSGLPGTNGTPYWGWLIGVSVTGGGEFKVPQGSFGFGMSFGDSGTSPLLLYAGMPNGFPDANGQIDVFNIYIPDVATGICGNYWFGGSPYNFSSWYLELFVGDGVPSAACNWYCGTGVNIPNDGFVINTPAAAGGQFSGTITHPLGTHIGAAMALYDTPWSWVHPTWGEVLVDFVTGADILGGWPVFIGAPVNFSLGVPINLGLIGMQFYVQAGSFGGSIILHCAFDCVIGY
jgi:hypothetical protein